MFCPRCGTEIHDSSRFCASCGTRLSDLGVPSTSEAAAAAPESATPPGVPPVRPVTGDAAGAVVNVYGGFWRRLAAYFLDLLVVMPTLLVVEFVLRAVQLVDDQSLGVVYFISIATTWLYSALLESSSRQATVGKMVLGIVVTDLKGERIGFGRATGRHFAKILSTLTLGIGYVMAGFTGRRQGLHDMIAGTLVVKKDTSAAMLAGHPEAPPVSGWKVALLVLVVAVVPVTGILAAIAIPAYQDYLIRSQVYDGLASATAYKAAVVEAVASGTDWDSLSTAGLELNTQGQSKYLVAREVIGGVIMLTYGGQANKKIAGGTLVLVPGVTATGEVVWVCGYGSAPEGVNLVIDDHKQYTDVEPKYLPSMCRS